MLGSSWFKEIIRRAEWSRGVQGVPLVRGCQTLTLWSVLMIKFQLTLDAALQVYQAQILIVCQVLILLRSYSVRQSSELGKRVIIHLIWKRLHKSLPETETIQKVKSVMSAILQGNIEKQLLSKFLISTAIVNTFTKRTLRMRTTWLIREITITIIPWT